jgi:hypothetical protein
MFVIEYLPHADDQPLFLPPRPLPLCVGRLTSLLFIIPSFASFFAHLLRQEAVLVGSIGLARRRSSNGAGRRQRRVPFLRQALRRPLAALLQPYEQEVNASHPISYLPISVNVFSEVGFATAAVQVLAAEDANAQWLLGDFLSFFGVRNSESLAA